MFNQITNHIAQAQARLIAQYKNKLRINGVLAGMVAPIQDIEDALMTMNLLRAIDGSVGVQLDLIGGIVGLPRMNGWDDETYRTQLRARIKMNDSQATGPEIIDAFAVLSGAQTIIYDDLSLAAVAMESEISFTQEESNNIIPLMQRVVAGGVRFEGMTICDADNPFAMDGVFVGGGFGDTTDPLAGGLFASVINELHNFAMAGNEPTPQGFGDVYDPLVGGGLVAV